MFLNIMNEIITADWWINKIFVLWILKITNRDCKSKTIAFLETYMQIYCKELIGGTVPSYINLSWFKNTVFYNCLLG